MPEDPSRPDPPQEPPVDPKTHRCGTLVYTNAALVVLFFWLLWGDFCFTVMESVTGPIMQLKFLAQNASMTEIAVIITTIPGLVYSVLNPIVSFKSDRYRSRLGRRIPFILYCLPMIVLFLVGLAFGDRMALWLHAHLGFLHWIPANQLTILTLGVLLIGFSFFNTLGTTTFWYLFNDVVPDHLLARFMSWFRFISQASAALYSFLIFPLSGTHSTEIFIGAALLYLCGFGLMCLNVREGEYPPPPPYVGGKTGPIAAITTYAAETHAFPHYWYLWICTFIGGISGGGSVVGASTFGLFFSLAIGLNLKQIGIINGSLTATVSILTLAAGWLADRYHPIRVVVAGAGISLFVGAPATMIWLFWHPAPNVVFIVVMVLTMGIAAPSMALGSMWDPPMLMRLFPRDNYGQFCSTNGVWRMVGGMCGGAMTGVFLDIMTRYVGRERALYYLPVWSFVFGIPSYLLLLKLYYSWKRHGGDDNYVAPMLTPVEPLPTNVVTNIS